MQVDALGFQAGEEMEPGDGIFPLDQFPGQDLLASGLGPDAKSYQNAALEAAFDRAQPALRIPPLRDLGAQLCQVEAVNL